ncbi:MAG: aspartate 1-decarboxylase [Turicibacter sp.]|nr:aspartate 1-decarboxylase [Turicibacter sp.]
MIEILQSKIHRAVVSAADINYEGSITIPDHIMEKAGICEYQKVLVVDINNGNRFETYVIKTDQPNYFCLNGAAARLVTVGDRIIVMAFQYVDAVPNDYQPTILLLDRNNEIKP